VPALEFVEKIRPLAHQAKIESIARLFAVRGTAETETGMKTFPPLSGGIVAQTRKQSATREAAVPIPHAGADRYKMSRESGSGLRRKRDRVLPGCQQILEPPILPQRIPDRIEFQERRRYDVSGRH
jgi:hypothetical protein